MPQGAYRLADAKPLGAFSMADIQAESPATTRTWGDTALDVGTGLLKGAGSTIAGIGELAGNAGLLPGVIPAAFTPELRHPAFTRAEEATTARTDPQRVGKGLETAAEFALPAMEVGKAGMALLKPATALVRSAGPMAMEIGSHLPVVGAPIRLARTGAKILGRVLDLAAPEASAVTNAGGRLVPGAGRTLDTELAQALAELRAPAVAPSVELPPPAQLPAGYTPRTTAPAPGPASAPPTAPTGRLVPGTPQPSLEQQLAETLAEARQPAPPTRITTPPARTLPPGYDPRTSLGPRNYFLKSDAVAPAAAAAQEPAAVAMSDLPASWQKLTLPATFPPKAIEGSKLAAAFQQELVRRGVNASDAIRMVAQNADLPPAVKTQLLTALGKVARQQ